FEAEDGIRDWSVTGVQTCALPISDDERGSARGADGGHLRLDEVSYRGGVEGREGHVPAVQHADGAEHVEQVDRVEGLEQRAGPRSEERRVGEEGRSGRVASQ